MEQICDSCYQLSMSEKKLACDYTRGVWSWSCAGSPMSLNLIQCWTLFLCTKNDSYKGIHGSSHNKMITGSLIFQMAKLMLETNSALVNNRVS